jgi:hypothetical protein
MTTEQSGTTDQATEVAGSATREAVKTDLRTHDEEDTGAPGSANTARALEVDLPGTTYDITPGNEETAP